MIDITDKLFVESLNRVAASDDGKIVIAYLKDILGWDVTDMSFDESANIHTATKRYVYSGIRKNIQPHLLKEIEFNYKRKVENDRSGSKSNKRNGSRNRTA